MKFIKFFKIKAFTLAEILVVISILGIVAALTIPTVVRRQLEATSRTKLKKAMKVYDLFVQKYTIEKGIHSLAELKQSAAAQNCAEPLTYFKKVSGEGCQFKTADGVEWDISDITDAKITLPKNKDKKGNILTFDFITSFDPKSGAFRSNDIGYESANFNIPALLKLGPLAKELGIEEDICPYKMCNYARGVYNNGDYAKVCEHGGVGETCSEERTVYVLSSKTWNLEPQTSKYFYENGNLTFTLLPSTDVAQYVYDGEGNLAGYYVCTADMSECACQGDCSGMQ